ncbi:pyocin knob domain-containing S74 family peptidase [Flagellimonas aurea]|uniref:pyocin knob domain-containing S74 family peptidase n=1 Tax=Flagellimonas aurea TaxID=2915619 RepID=UPI0035D1386C
MKRNRSTLKSYFQTGDYPNESQFADLIDSFLSVSEDDASIGSIAIAMNSFSDGKSLSIYAPGSSSYVSMDPNGWSILGNTSANDGQDSHLIVKRNGGLEFNDNGSVYKVWHAGNDELVMKGINDSLSNGSDWDTYLTQGIYKVQNAPNTDNGAPPHQYGYGLLHVLKSGVASENRTLQIYYPHSTSDENHYVRMYNTSGWNEWRIVPHTVGGQKIWTNNNDGSGSGLDADTLDGLQASVFVRNDGGSGTRFSSTYLQFVGDGASNNDYISFNDSTNGFYFNADTTRQNTTANANVYAGEFFAGGAYYYGDNKRIIQFSDGWLRINPANDFNSGIFCGSGILRTDGQFECGPAGSDFKVTTSGVVTAAGTVTATNFILSSDERLKKEVSDLKTENLNVGWKSFFVKNEKERRYGVIAQDLEREHPEFIRTDEDGYKSVAYIDLLVAKMAEKDEQIEQLTNRLVHLEELLKK